MINPISVLSMLTCMLCAMNVSAQQTYKGTMVNKFGSSQTGLITVNLDGPNEELIEITEEQKPGSKKRGKKEKLTLTTSTKLNTAIISHIIINDTTYYFRDIKYGYNEKKYMNCCVRLVSGSLECGLFQTGRSADPKQMAAKLPSSEFSQLVSTEFDYYKELSGWHLMAFSKCTSLQEKMMNKEAGYSWEPGSTKTEQLKVWEKWIREYNGCK